MLFSAWNAAPDSSPAGIVERAWALESETWVWILASQLSSCVTLDEYLEQMFNFFEPQSPTL